MSSMWPVMLVTLVSPALYKVARTSEEIKVKDEEMVNNYQRQIRSFLCLC